MTQKPKRSRAIFWRILLTVIFLVVAAIPLGIYVFNQTLSNAPIEIGGGDIQDDTVYEAGDEIPYGSTPNDLLLITDRDGDWDVAVLQTDGTLVNLTHDDTGAEDLMPTWSFDGDAITFVSNRVDPINLGPTIVRVSDPNNVQTLSVLTGAITMFRDRQFDWDAKYSPDASQLVWVSVRDLNLELYQIPTDVEFVIDNATKLSDGNGRSWYPQFAPDGTQILFNSTGAGDENIYLMDLATGDVTQLTDAGEQDIRGIWSLDGSIVAFATERRATFVEGGLDLFIMNPDGSDQRPLPDDMVFEGGAVWSPGGTHIAYLSNIEGSWQIYVMQTDGSNLRRVTDGEANYLLPAWRP